MMFNLAPPIHILLPRCFKIIAALWNTPYLHVKCHESLWVLSVSSFPPWLKNLSTTHHMNLLLHDGLHDMVYLHLVSCNMAKASSALQWQKDQRLLRAWHLLCPTLLYGVPLSLFCLRNAVEFMVTANWICIKRTLSLLRMQCSWNHRTFSMLSYKKLQLKYIYPQNTT